MAHLHTYLVYNRENVTVSCHFLGVPFCKLQIGHLVPSWLSHESRSKAGQVQQELWILPTHEDFWPECGRSLSMGSSAGSSCWALNGSFFLMPEEPNGSNLLESCWSYANVIHCYAWLKTLVRWATVMRLTCKAKSIRKSQIVVIRTIMPERQSHRTAKQSQKLQSTEVRVTGLAMGWRKVGRNHHMRSCSLAVRYGCLAAQCNCTWLT